MISVFKFCLIWGIFLTWFADSMLFDMMIKTEYLDGVNTVQELIDKDMSLGIDLTYVKYNFKKFFFSSSTLLRNRSG